MSAIEGERWVAAEIQKARRCAGGEEIGSLETNRRPSILSIELHAMLRSEK